MNHLSAVDSADDGGGDGASEAIIYTNEYIEIQTIFDPNFETSITTSIFDPYQELFWTGNSEGRVTSHFSTSLSKYTSFRVKSGENSDIRTLYPHANGDIYVLNADMLSSYSRFGVNTFKHKDVSFHNMQCLFMNQQQRFFLGGFCGHIYDFDIERLRILRQLSISDEQSDCIIIKSSGSSTNNSGSQSMAARNGYLCTGCTNGQILLREPFSLRVQHTFHPHNGNLSDFDVHGNYLVSCGFSLNRSGNMCVDRFLMIYDLRMLRSLAPVQVLIEPCFIHFLPMCSSVVAVASQAGCFQIMDINLLTPTSFYQAQVPIGGLSTTFAMSGNAQAFAFGHSTGSVHLFTKGENELFNDFSEPTFFAEPPQISPNFIDINHEMAPLSSIPIPIGYSSLVSDWPEIDPMPKFRPTPPVSGELMENARVINNIASTPNRVNIMRNQIFNERYQSHLSELEVRSKGTNINLAELAPLFSKPIVEAKKNAESSASTPTETQIVRKENDENL